MKSNIKYLGSSPRHALKLTWELEGQHTLEEIFRIFGSHYPGKPQLDLSFVKWFKATYLDRLGKDFGLELYKEEFPEEEQKLEESLLKEWDDSELPQKTGKINIESSKLEVASSMKEAQSRLRKMRHPDEVGEINRDSSEMRENVTGPDMIRAQPKPGTQTMTGDDLEARSSIKQSNKQKNITGLMLSDQGGVVNIIPTSKEEQQKRDRKFAEMSGKIKYIDEDTLQESGDSRVITGDSFNADGEDTPSYKTHTEDNNRKVNKSFKAFPMFNASDGSEILPSHILGAENDREAIRLIKMCKSSTTLKVAKIYLQDRGNHKLIEEVEDQLRLIPPGQ